MHRAGIRSTLEIALPSRRPRPLGGSAERYSICDCRSICAIRDVHNQYPDGFDIATLFADAMTHVTRKQLLSLRTRERTSTRRNSINHPGVWFSPE